MIQQSTIPTTLLVSLNNSLKAYQTLLAVIQDAIEDPDLDEKTLQTVIDRARLKDVQI
jgi:hypothetical protein